MINETRKIQSVERSFMILEALSISENAVPLQQLSADLAINKTTLHGLLNTMASLGYVQNSTQGYSLGMRLTELTRPLETKYDRLRSQYMPLIRDMAGSTGNTAYLAIACGCQQYLYIDAVEGEHPLTIRSPRGKREGLTTSAIGRLFLALDDEQNFRRSLRKAGLLDAALEQKLDMIVHQGYSIDHGGAQEGLSCMSIPLYHNGKLVAAAGMSGPSIELTTPKLSHYAHIFKKQAAHYR